MIQSEVTQEPLGFLFTKLETHEVQYLKNLIKTEFIHCHIERESFVSSDGSLRVNHLDHRDMNLRDSYWYGELLITANDKRYLEFMKYLFLDRKNMLLTCQKLFEDSNVSNGNIIKLNTYKGSKET